MNLSYVTLRQGGKEERIEVSDISGAVLGIYLGLRETQRLDSPWDVVLPHGETISGVESAIEYLSPNILMTEADYHPLKIAEGSQLVIPVINPRGKYTHFTFRSMEFIFSLIEALDLFELEFRDYIYGVPYQITDGQVIYKRIDGYDIQVPKWGHPMTPQPFTDTTPDDETLYIYIS
jgi:hypothetical protein